MWAGLCLVLLLSRRTKGSISFSPETNHATGRGPIALGHSGPRRPRPLFQINASRHVDRHRHPASGKKRLRKRSPNNQRTLTPFSRPYRRSPGGFWGRRSVRTPGRAARLAVDHGARETELPAWKRSETSDRLSALRPVPTFLDTLQRTAMSLGPRASAWLRRPSSHGRDPHRPRAARSCHRRLDVQLTGRLNCRHLASRR